MVVRQLLEHGGVGGVAALVLLERPKAEHLEQNVRELLGAVEVELLPRDLDDVRAQLVELGLRRGTQLGQAVAVHGRARALDDGEHRHERQVDIEVGALALVASERLGERVDEHARSRGLHRGGGGLVLRLGQHAAAVGVEQRVVGVFGHRRVQHVAGQPQIERAHGHELRVVHEGGARRVGRIHAMHLALHVERGERTGRHDAGERLEALVVLEQRRALARVHRAVQPRVEQRHLLGLQERHAHRLVAGDGRVHERASLRAGHHGLHHERGRLLLQLPAHQLEHAVEVRVELHRLERLGDGVGVERGEGASLEVEGEVEVAHDGGHLAAQKRHVLVVDHLLLLLALELVDVLVDALEVAVGLQQLGRRLVADAGHARDVVRRVALEAEEVDELVGAHAVALLHLGGPVDGHVGDALLRGDDARLVGGQLVGVLIAGDEQRLVAQRLVARGDGAQHVVALPALDAHHGHVHGFKQLLDDGKLHFEIVVHGRALRLVLFKRLHAKCRPSRIESADERVGVRHVDELEQHGKKAEHGVRRPAVGGVHGLRHGMIGTVHERVAVDDGDLLGHKARPPSFSLSSDQYRATGRAPAHPLCEKQRIPH